MVRLQNTALVLFLAFFTLVAGTVPVYFDATLRFASHLILLAIVAGWLAVLVVRRRSFPRTPIDLPLWLFLGAMALSTVFSVNRRVSLELLAVNLLYALLFYVVVDFVRTEGAMSRLIRATLAVSSLVIGLALTEVVGWYLGLFPSLGFEQGWPQIGGLQLVPPVFRRTWLVMSVPNTLGAYLVLVIPLGLGVAGALPLRGRRVLTGVWMVLSSVVLFFTFSRGAWLGFAASLPVLALPIYRRGVLGWLRVLFGIRRSELQRPPEGLNNSVLSYAYAGASRRGGRLCPPKGRAGGQSRPPLRRAGGSIPSRVAIVSVLLLGLSVLLVVLVARPTAQLLSGRGSEEARMILYRNALQMASERPVLGYGLGTFGQVNLGRVSGTRLQDAVHGHAHNAYLNNLAEMGALGTLALLWLLVALARGAWTAVRRAGDARSRALAIAAAAGLVGSAVQDLFETPLDQPALLLTTMILVAVLLEIPRRWAPERIEPGQAVLCTRLGRCLVPAALVGWGAIAAALLYVGWANLVYAQGVSAALRSDWDRAKQLIARAVEMDPTLLVYRFELAYAEAQSSMASGDRDGLNRAARDFADALAQDGNYAANYVNLAMVNESGGRSADAIAAMQSAIKLDDVNALYYLNLGLLYEQGGQQDAAVDSYSRAIIRDLSLLRQSFWRTSPERRVLLPRILEKVKAEVSPAVVTAATQTLPLDYGEITVAVARAIALSAGGQPDLALPILDQLIARRSESARLWMERARVYLILGALDKAEKDLRVALFIDPGPLTHYYLGELARLRGDRASARREFSRFVLAHAVPTGYSTLIYRRGGILEPYLPGLVQFTLNDDLVEPVLGIARFHDEIGQPQRAAEIYARLLEYDPELEVAREALARTATSY
ncbi:MAG: tetratricopeptide repeat protein [Chloroflexota bacterium]|nr:MAG: tetratricopeptide repeat protein [Chloroflexota bacterium]